jgi:hypothetical protein
MQADRVLKVLNVGRLLPVLQVLEIIDESRVLKVATLGKKVKIVGVAQALYKFQFGLQPQPLFLLLVREGHMLRR